MTDDRSWARDLRHAARKADEWRQRRDAQVVAASARGISLREIARVAGLSHPGVRRIVERYRRTD